MSDLLFHKAAMSQGHIEELMEIWTLSMMEMDGSPPFDSYRQMYEAIDEIQVGSTPWECFKMEIDNNLPDKTTVSVATGNVEYHPLYLTISNPHNSIRWAHSNAVIPIGFLAILKCMLVSKL